MLCSVASGLISWKFEDEIFQQMYVETGMEVFEYSMVNGLVDFMVTVNIGNALIWISIFCVKSSFAIFFKKLVSRTRYLETWWYIVIAVLAVSVCVIIPFFLFICHDFTPNFIGKSYRVYSPVIS